MRRSCESILALVKSLDKNLHIQHFNRKNGFCFIVKGLNIAEIKLGSGGFILLQIQNTKVIGSNRPKQIKKKFIFTGIEKPPFQFLNSVITSSQKVILACLNSDWIKNEEMTCTSKNLLYQSDF